MFAIEDGTYMAFYFINNIFCTGICNVFIWMNTKREVLFYNMDFNAWHSVPTSKIIFVTHIDALATHMDANMEIQYRELTDAVFMYSLMYQYRFDVTRFLIHPFVAKHTQLQQKVLYILGLLIIFTLFEFSNF